MKYCVKCGHELAEGAKFCPACGHPVEALEQSQSEKPVQPTETTAGQEAPIEPESKVEQAQYNHEEQHEQATSQQEKEQPQLGFIGSIQYIMEHVFEFSGGKPESRKSVFWWGFLAVYLLNFVFVFIPVIGKLFVWLSAILLVSATMRRLDYIGKNSGIAWLMMIPLVAIYPLVLMFFDKKG